MFNIFTIVGTLILAFPIIIVLGWMTENVGECIVGSCGLLICVSAYLVAWMYVYE